MQAKFWDLGLKWPWSYRLLLLPHCDQGKEVLTCWYHAEQIIMIGNVIWGRFLSLVWSKFRPCSANHRAGYFHNLACDWLSIVWAYSEQETENGHRCPLLGLQSWYPSSLSSDQLYLIRCFISRLIGACNIHSKCDVNPVASYTYFT